MKRLILSILVAVSMSACATTNKVSEVATTNIPPTTYQITKAKNIYREKHPACEYCGLKKTFFGGKNLPVHHLCPVHVDPMVATSQTNLITLCPVHHFTIGHFGNYKDHNSQVRETIKILKMVEDACKSEFLKKYKKTKKKKVIKNESNEKSNE
ncbi:MAG: HNH endonuclease [Thermoplasmatales archaeon]|nr:MAG: HNH endonuclease [Thermoplasmatales archaeon]